MRRGVAIQVCMTYASSWKIPFNSLSETSARVRTNAQTASLYIHLKMIPVVDKQAVIGSENFSPPSLVANRELRLALSNQNLISELAQTFAGDWTIARSYLVNQ